MEQSESIETQKLEVGDKAPDFSLSSADGKTVSLHDFAGQKVIIYFYPAAMTPACTTQACDFRDNIARLSALGYQVIGISKDSVEKLKRFAERDNLPFPLLSDVDLHVHKAYGAYGTRNLYGKKVTGTLRSTIIVDEQGVVRFARYNVKAKGHVAMLLKILEA